MRNSYRSAVLVAMLAVAGSAAQAQSGVQFGLGGGITTPMGSLNDATKTGYHGLVVLGFQGPASLPIGFRVDGLFQRLGYTVAPLSTNDQAFQTMAFIGNAVYTIKMSETQKIRPYLIGGVGYYRSKTTNGNLNENGSSTGYTGDVGVNGGLGINFVVGHVGLFLEGRYHHVFSDGGHAGFIPITLGAKVGG